MTGPCRELIDAQAFGAARYCGCPGVGVSLPCPAGRPDADGGPYCEEHGGEGRARREAEADSNFLAPASVGDAMAVLHAGTMMLDSRDAYVMVREERGYWLAFLGVGSFFTGVPNPSTRVTWARGEHPPKGVPHRKRGESSEAWRTRCATVGGYRFLTREDAEAEGRRAWRAQVDRHVAEIRASRGGTLAWGVPVEPRSEPIIVDATGRNSWDALT